MNLEERKKNLLDKQIQIKTECERLNGQIRSIIGKAEGAVSSLEKLTTCDFLKKYTSVYEYLNKLHIKILDSNCLLDIFQLELDESTCFQLTDGLKSDTSKESNKVDKWCGNDIIQSPTQEKNTKLNPHAKEFIVSDGILKSCTAIEKASTAKNTRGYEDEIPFPRNSPKLESPNHNKNDQTECALSSSNTEKISRNNIVEQSKNKLSRKRARVDIRNLVKKEDKNVDEILESFPVRVEKTSTAKNVRGYEDDIPFLHYSPKLESPNRNKNDQTALSSSREKISSINIVDQSKNKLSNVNKKYASLEIQKLVKEEDKKVETSTQYNISKNADDFVVPLKSHKPAADHLKSQNKNKIEFPDRPEKVESPKKENIEKNLKTEKSLADKKKLFDSFFGNYNSVFENESKLKTKTVKKQNLHIVGATANGNEEFLTSPNRSIKNGSKPIKDPKPPNGAPDNLTEGVVTRLKKYDLYVEKERSSNNSSENACFVSMNYDKLKCRIDQHYKDRERQHWVQVPSVSINQPKEMKGNISVEEEKQEEIVKKQETLEFKRGTLPKNGDKCYVSCAEAPNHFYIQLISEETAIIDTISEEINQMADSLPYYNTKNEAIERLGDYCVCFCVELNEWHRAEIIDWLLDDDMYISVRTVDHGYATLVTLNYIRGTNSNICKLPKMALRCSLGWIKPLESKDWSENAVNHFYSLVDPEKNQIFTVTVLEHYVDRVIVDLQSDTYESIIEKMVDSKYVDYNLPEPGNGCKVNSEIEAHIRDVQGLDESSDENEEIEDNYLFKQVFPYMGKDEREICHFWLKNKYCFKGNSCTFSHKPLNPDGWTTDREAVFIEAFNTLDLPCVGQEVTVRVLNILDLRNFYAIIKKSSDITSIDIGPINTMKKLINHMNSPTEVATLNRPTIIPAFAQIILVKNENVYQRARVTGILNNPKNTQIEAFLVDLGIKTTVDLKNVREIKQTYLNLPFQAVHCQLSNVAHKESLSADKYEMGMDYLALNTLDLKLRAKVMYRNKNIGLILYNEDDEDIGEMLIAADIVDRVTTALVPKDDRLLVD